MTGPGLLSIILGFIIMILVIANGLMAQGVLMTREQKIRIFLDKILSSPIPKSKKGSKYLMKK